MALLAAGVLPWAGCAGTVSLEETAQPRREVNAAGLRADELGQSDVNRVATLAMRDNLDSLFLLMDKLYRRNPQEWRKGAALSRDDATARVRLAVLGRQAWPALGGRRDITALAHALAPAFAGDRVAAFIHALADMLVAAHGGKTVFYLLDGLDAQTIYNAARNVEIAVWMLAQRKDGNGRPLLLADEIGADARNLSFEREFGKIIGRLDLLSAVVAEKYRRAVIGYVQNLVGGSLLQFLPVQGLGR